MVETDVEDLSHPFPLFLNVFPFINSAFDTVDGPVMHFIASLNYSTASHGKKLEPIRIRDIQL